MRMSWCDLTVRITNVKFSSCCRRLQCHHIVASNQDMISSVSRWLWTISLSVCGAAHTHFTPPAPAPHWLTVACTLLVPEHASVSCERVRRCEILHVWPALVPGDDWLLTPHLAWLQKWLCDPRLPPGTLTVPSELDTAQCRSSPLSPLDTWKVSRPHPTACFPPCWSTKHGIQRREPALYYLTVFVV